MTGPPPPPRHPPPAPSSATTPSPARTPRSTRAPPGPTRRRGCPPATPTTAPGTIAPAGLDIHATSDSKPYDGSTSAAATPTVAGLVSGDTVTGLGEVFDTRAAGTGKTLSVSAYTVNDGNGGHNYAVTLV